MITIQKSQPPIPGLSTFFLIPVQEVWVFLPPVVFVENTEAIVNFQFAVDSVSFTQALVSEKDNNTFNMVFSGFLAGISDTQTKQLMAAQASMYIVVAVDYNNKQWMAGTPQNPFMLNFTQNNHRVGYNIVLSSVVKGPLQPINLVIPDNKPPQPVDVVNIGIEISPAYLPEDLVSPLGKFTLPLTMWLQLSAAAGARVAGSKYSFVRWARYPISDPTQVEEFSTDRNHGFVLDVSHNNTIFVAEYISSAPGATADVTFNQPEKLFVTVPQEWLTGAGTFNIGSIVTISATLSGQLPGNGTDVKFVEWLSYPAGQENLIEHRSSNNEFTFGLTEDTVFVPHYEEV